MNRKQKKALRGIIISAVLLILVNITNMPEPAATLIFAAAYLIVGRDVLCKAFRGMINGRVCDENFLMAAATVGAIALAVYEKSGDYSEAVAVMLFYQTGELFESYAVGKSRRNIAELMDIRPDCANLEADGEITELSPEEVGVGSVIVCRPGERIPLDGIIIEGSTSINTSALTGESLPRDATAGDEVISGCINMSGLIRVRTTKLFGESTVSKILELVENASSRKSRQENFISRFARIYTPAVCLAALALGTVPPLIGIITGGAASWNVWLYRALTFLVISCPCALVISIPLSFFAGLGGASREGILIKGSNYLEALSRVKTLVFDKTGTLTCGVFEVSGIHHCTVGEDKLIEYAALAECASSHPISRSIIDCYGREPDRSRVSGITEYGGMGITAEADGKALAVGNEKLMRSLGIDYIQCRCTGTVVHIAIDGDYAGHILISDREKPTAADAVKALKAAGVTSCVMLTGDSESAAAEISKRLGIGEYHSSLLPADKVAWVEKLMGQMKSGEKLAFAGDGINDAPVLSRADIGIAMGALGSDAAIEAADVVLMDDEPMKIARAIAISKKCLTIVYENIIFSLAVKLTCLALGAFGIADMWLAIFADVGVMVIAVLNSMRCLRS